jgi:nitrogen fixation NifU-like protein
VSTDRNNFQKLYETAVKQAYTETVLDHGRNPRNLEDLIDNNASGVVFGPCGDTMVIWLRVEDGAIADISFTTDGCMTSLAAGSMVTELAKGRDISDALKISQQDILDALGGLPKESEHCALLAANTLKEAISNYKAKQAG